MSASREKKKRQELYENGSLQRDEKKTQKTGSSKVTRIVASVAAIVLVVAFVLLMIVNSGAFLNSVTAVTVGDNNMSAGLSSYYYWDAVSTVANYYGDYFSYFVDTSKPYKSQAYSEDQTWADFFMQTGESNMQEVTILCDEAAKAGFTLSADELAAIDSNISAMNSTAVSNGFKSGEAYLKTFYGKAANEKTFKEYLTKRTLANSFYNEFYKNNFTYTDSELMDYYNADPNRFDTVSYRLLTINGSGTEDGNTAEQAQATANDIAEASAFNENMFLSRANNYSNPDGTEEYDADSATLNENSTYAKTNSAFADWLFDSARIEGETYVANSGTSYYVVFFLGRQVPDYQMVNVRHILLSVSDTSDATAMADTLAEAEAILADWEAGEATEDSFAALANEKSQDPGSNTNGGLYTNVYQGQMVESFNDWCFDPNRQVGDTGIVETSYGYHIMYYSGTSTDYTSYLTYTVENTMRAEDYSEWFSAKTESYPIAEKGLGMLFVHQ